MTTKDKQKEIVVAALKPLFKRWGYKTNGQNWWKVNGAFFNVINLQNFSWNTKDQVDFCFNFTTGLSKTIFNKSKVVIHDGVTYIREPSFLPDTKTEFRDQVGYHLTSGTNFEKFKEEILNDFDLIILPKLDTLNTPSNLLDFYKKEFFAAALKVALKKEGYIK